MKKKVLIVLDLLRCNNRTLQVAKELEKIAFRDNYFIEKLPKC